jgi:hypothetical protein
MIVYNNYIFITPAKTGSNSLLKALYDISTTEKDIVIREKPIHSVLVPEKFKNYKKVLLVRNPYEVVISRYFDDDNHNMGPDNIVKYMKSIKQNYNRILFTEKHDIFINEEKEDNILEFTKKYKDTRPDDVEHFNEKMILTTYRTPGEAAILSNPDIIIHLETIKEDLEKLGIFVKNNKFPHERIGHKRNGLKIKNIINTQEKIDFFNEYFNCAKDAIRFGYKPIYTIDDL